MTKQLAEFLKKAADHCEKQEVDVREHYSGRGMFGANTCGIVVDSVPQLLVDVVQYVKERLEDCQGSTDMTDAFTVSIPEFEELGQLRTDNMGHRTILY